MKIIILLWACLSVILAIGEVAAVREKRLRYEIQNRDTQIVQLGQQLVETEAKLAADDIKLGYLDKYSKRVLVTAYTTRQGELSRHGWGYWFANGERTRGAFGVVGSILPQDHILNVALSPSAQAALHARMNDYLAFRLSGSNKVLLARFVDTTSKDQKKPVVDVFFRDRIAASEWGCKRGYAVDVSRRVAPF